MPFAGGPFEEFVAEYLRYMPEYDGYIVNAHFDYKRSRDLQRQVRGKAGKQAVWSDIDVLAIRGDVAIIVSCDENCQKKLSQILEELQFGEYYIRQKYSFVKSLKKFYAFTMAWGPKADRRKLEKLEANKVKVLTYADMVRDFIEVLRKREKYGVTGGKFTEPIMWALREIDEIRGLTGEDVLPPIEANFKKHNIIIHWP